MYSQNEIDFNRIAEAIYFIKNNFIAEPRLEEIAQHVHISPAHFQKMFIEWAGVSPNKFSAIHFTNPCKIKIEKRRGDAL